MRRGGYTKDLKHELKFRGSNQLWDQIKGISEQKEMTIAAVLRDLVVQALQQRQPKTSGYPKA